MTAAGAAPLLRGRALALVGIVLLALNLRTAVASLSPVLDHIDGDIPLTSLGVGLLGMLPPVCFAVFGLLAPAIAHRIGLETTVLVAIVAMVGGHLGRALAPGYAGLLISSAIVLAGIGIGNVLLPPTVKRYFPDRIGLLTATTSALLAVSTALPALISAPVADGAGWRIDLALWAVVAFTAVAPWVGLWLAERERAPEITDPSAEVDEPDVPGGAWRSPVAWSIAVVFAASSFNAYAMFAWLPQIVGDLAGVDPFTGGALLSLYSFAGFPAGIVVPLLAVRMRNVGWLVQLGVLFFVVGYGGLLLAPGTATWFWATAAGLGPLLFPVALVLINLRSRTHRGSAVLSGFAQGVGYTVGATGPFLVGLGHDLSGGWTVPLLICAAVGLIAVPAGLVVGRPRMIEDDLGGGGGAARSRS